MPAVTQIPSPAVDTPSCDAKGYHTAANKNLDLSPRLGQQQGLFSELAGDDCRVGTAGLAEADDGCHHQLDAQRQPQSQRGNQAIKIQRRIFGLGQKLI